MHAMLNREDYEFLPMSEEARSLLFAILGGEGDYLNEDLLREVESYHGLINFHLPIDTRILTLANNWLGGHGIEGLPADEEDYSRGARSLMYVNMGDTYDATLCYDSKEGFLVSSWGDWYEKMERERAEEEEAEEAAEYEE
jgi:hypothetical protein